VRRKWENGIRTAARTSGRNSSTGVFDAASLERSIRVGHVEEGRGEIKLARRTREERVYDVYIAALARYERDRSESYLLIEGGEELDDDDNDDDGRRTFERDLFGVSQPKARSEDLLIERGTRHGWIESVRAGVLEEGERARGQVREEDVKVELKLKTAKLLLPVLGTGGRAVYRSVVEVERLPDGTLEEVAYHLATEFGRTRWRRIDGERGGIVWYEF
jgi:hypothetical protein